jgi:chromosome segregation ATPase
LDYSSPESNTVQLSYDYNPVWVSFRPTFWVSFLAVIGCVAAVFIRRRKPSEKEPTITRTERLPTQQPMPTTSSQQAKSVEPITGQRITTENVREFTDDYEEKKQLNTELKSLDTRAQKGKIPRRQYKVQRRAIEIRLETLTRNTNRIKDVFRSSTSLYSDLAKQLDAAETDLVEAEENIKKLESRQSTGEISLETYKKNIGDYQKRKDKAESTINGILLRLREKTR